MPTHPVNARKLKRAAVLLTAGALVTVGFAGPPRAEAAPVRGGGAVMSAQTLRALRPGDVITTKRVTPSALLVPARGTEISYRTTGQLGEATWTTTTVLEPVGGSASSRSLHLPSGSAGTRRQVAAVLGLPEDASRARIERSFAASASSMRSRSVRKHAHESRADGRTRQLVSHQEFYDGLAP